MLDVRQFRDSVVDPTLVDLGLYSKAASNLLLGTALQESKLKWLRQLGNGPARGLFQMEPATHNDIYAHYLRYNSELEKRVLRLTAALPSQVEQLETNLAYSCAMARVHYWRRPEPLPAAEDIEGLAGYWKRFYNTHLGAGTTEEFVRAWRKHAEGI